MSHSAAWLSEKGAQLQVGPADTPTPGPTELLVRVKVIAFSPIEYKQQRMLLQPVTLPNNVGLSYAGTVEQVGQGVKTFAVGDKVTVLRGSSKLNDPRYGSHQQFALTDAIDASKLLPNTPLEAGAASVLNLATVYSALTFHLGLDRPSLTGTPAPKKGQKVLIYGGSSSAGNLAIRYAKAGGYDIVTTSSPRNHDFVSALGPDTIFDHTQPHEKLVESVKANGPYSAIFDTIGVPPVTHVITEYLAGLGGGKYNTLLPDFGNQKPIPEGVTRKFLPYGSEVQSNDHPEAKAWFYGHLLPEGLESGVIMPNQLQWVKGGLGQVQHALDLMGDNKVSGVKLVLDPWE